MMKVKVAQLCPTLCDLMDYTVHGIPQARILEWVAFSFPRGSSQPRDQTQVSHIAGGFFTSWATKGSPRILAWVAYPFPRGSSSDKNQTSISCIVGRFFTSWAITEIMSESKTFLTSQWRQNSRCFCFFISIFFGCAGPLLQRAGSSLFIAACNS